MTHHESSELPRAEEVELDHAIHDDHEPSDVEVNGLVRFLAALVGSLIVVALVVFWQYRHSSQAARNRGEPANRLATQRLPPPPPLLQVSPPRDLQQFRAYEDEQLSRWEWKDRSHSYARIPIDRAIDWVAENGRPHWRADSDEQRSSSSGSSSRPRSEEQP